MNLAIPAHANDIYHLCFLIFLGICFGRIEHANEASDFVFLNTVISNLLLVISILLLATNSLVEVLEYL